MQAGTAYLWHYNQLAGIVYRNIFPDYRLEIPGSKWVPPPKVVENNRAEIPWNFHIQSDMMVMVDKQDMKAVVVDVAIQSNSPIRKK